MLAEAHLGAFKQVFVVVCGMVTVRFRQFDCSEVQGRPGATHRGERAPQSSRIRPTSNGRLTFGIPAAEIADMHSAEACESAFSAPSIIHATGQRLNRSPQLAMRMNLFFSPQPAIIAANCPSAEAEGPTSANRENHDRHFTRLRFTPIFRRYLWGGRRLATVLNKPLGRRRRLCRKLGSRRPRRGPKCRSCRSVGRYAVCTNWCNSFPGPCSASTIRPSDFRCCSSFSTRTETSRCRSIPDDQQAAAIVAARSWQDGSLGDLGCSTRAAMSTRD